MWIVGVTTAAAALAAQPVPGGGARLPDKPAPATSAQTRTTPAPGVGAPTASEPAGPAPAAGGITRYEPSFFAQYRPTTALDMINNLPGFVEDDGDSTVRGYSGAGGNVLIDGRRPAAKGDTLSNILGRLNASDVDHIELIRGSAAGVDMQGRTVLANVVRKSGDSTKVVATAGTHIFADGHRIPNGSLVLSHRSGGRTYDLTLSRGASLDDGIGSGVYSVVPFGGAPQVQRAETDAGGGSVGLVGGYKGPLLGGDLRLNTRLVESYFKSRQSYGEPGAYTDEVNDRQRKWQAEVGANYDRRIGPVDVEAVFLQRFARTFNGDVETAPDLLAAFSGVNRTGESIGRLSGRYTPIPALTLEAGAEGAFNYLDGTAQFQFNGTDIPLPSANVHVEELRGEFLAQATWRALSTVTVEGGARFEVSTISQSGDASRERSFFYPKPRFALSWSFSPTGQLRLRAEKKVGQLDFNNFVSSTNLAQSQVNAGNPDLRPDQRWQYEVAVEQRFWGKGSVVATLTHEDIDDVVDLVPIIGPGYAFDAPGNIGSGTTDILNVEATLPLDRFGLKGGVLNSSSTWRISAVKDPLTGEDRRISSQRPKEITLKYTQDVPKLNSTFGVVYDQVWTEVSYRLAEVDHRIVTPRFLQVWGEYKPSPTLSFRLELSNLTPFLFKYQQDIYGGPRNLSALLETRELAIQSQRRVFVRVRKTF